MILGRVHPTWRIMHSYSQEHYLGRGGILPRVPPDRALTYRTYYTLEEVK